MSSAWFILSKVKLNTCRFTKRLRAWNSDDSDSTIYTFFASPCSSAEMHAKWPAPTRTPSENEMLSHLARVR